MENSPLPVSDQTSHTGQQPVAGARPGMYPVSRLWTYGVLVVAALAADLISKAIVFSRLGYPFRSSDWHWETPLLWGRFEIRLTTSFNQGALFGMGQGFTPVFALLSIGAVGFVLWWLFRKGEARSLWLTVALALVTAGAMGNLYDRLYFHGCRAVDGSPLTGVRDFLDCKIPWVSLSGVDGRGGPTLVREWPWPIFNFADCFLVCGAIMLLLQSLFAPQLSRDPPAVEVPSSASPSPGRLPATG